MTDGKQEIQASYKQLGEFGSFYDKILLRKGPGGKLANTLMWGSCLQRDFPRIEKGRLPGCEIISCAKKQL